MLVEQIMYGIVGLVLGFLAGLGVGGGSLLILWLTLFLEINTKDAQIINLLFFLACAGSVTLFRLKKGTLQLRSVLPGILAGCLFAVIFTVIGQRMPQGLLRKLFGVVLLTTGVRELLYRPRNAR